jgi:hypothetical protein
MSYPANQFLRDYWLDYHNKNFAAAACQPGTAFLPHKKFTL